MSAQVDLAGLLLWFLEKTSKGTRPHGPHVHLYIFIYTCLQAAQKEMPVASFNQLDFISNESVTADDETLLNIKNNRNLR